MNAPDRRHDVRVRPSAALPATAALIGTGIVHEALDIVDVSVGGLGLASEVAMAKVAVGERIRVALAMGEFGSFEAEAVVRWKGRATSGVQFASLSPEASTSLKRYVAELLERG